MKKQIEINNEESVIIHNAVIFMANDLMEEIVELEAYMKDLEDKQLLLPDGGKTEIERQIVDKKRRWQVMVALSEKAK